jgi:hypothetical protein
VSATEAAVLTYLKVAGEPRPMLLILRYMLTMHHKGAGATRTAVWRLCGAGKVERVGAGWYQYAKGGVDSDTH